MDRRNLQQDLHAGLRRFLLVSRTITEQRALGAGARRRFATKHAMLCLLVLSFAAAAAEPASAAAVDRRSTEDGCTEVEAFVRCGQDAQPQEHCQHLP